MKRMKEGRTYIHINSLYSNFQRERSCGGALKIFHPPKSLLLSTGQHYRKGKHTDSENELMIQQQQHSSIIIAKHTQNINIVVAPSSSSSSSIFLPLCIFKLYAVCYLTPSQLLSLSSWNYLKDRGAARAIVSFFLSVVTPKWGLQRISKAKKKGPRKLCGFLLSTASFPCLPEEVPARRPNNNNKKKKKKETSSSS